MTVLPPGRPLGGRVAPPGSKSITNRALLLAALATGTSRLTGALKSDDTALHGRGPARHGRRRRGAGRHQLRGQRHRPARARPTGPLFLGNAGTATRFLTAAAALVDGHGRGRRRRAHAQAPDRAPGRGAAALGVEAEAPTGCPPVTVQGTADSAAGRVEIDAGLSSQYVSALLMAAACGDGPIEVALTGAEIGARGYVDLTLAAMRAFGAEVGQPDAATWRVEPTGYRATDFHDRARRLGRDLSLGRRSADRRRHRPRRARPTPSPSPTPRPRR